MRLWPYHAEVARTGPCHAARAVIACTALLAAACAGPRAPAARQHPTSPQPQPPASRYLAIAAAGNRRLETDFNRLEGPDRNNLRAATADLRDVAATERLFDRHLLAINFPPAVKQTARLLSQANQSRARLTVDAAGSASLHQLRMFQRRLTAANALVEEEVRMIRRQLGLPPPQTS